MGLIMFGLVLLGFGAAAVARGTNPMDMPLLFHLHGGIFLAWFGLFIFQASLISKNNRELHITLGMFSPLLITAMLLTGWLMARDAYTRGISPIPEVAIPQFMAFPFFDLLGLLVFYPLALFYRNDAQSHKHAMLLTGVAILDPATARLGIVMGVPPFPVLASLALIGALMWYDRQQFRHIHIITWCALVWVFLRLAFVFGFATTELWSGIAVALFS